LRKADNIKKILSAFLLLIFTLGITPKKFLHDAFAIHTDKKPLSEKPYQLSKSGYKCDVNNLVAEPNFENISHLVTHPLSLNYSFILLKNISFSSALKVYSPLRGPPVNI
jgi:hypothetical protein